MKSLLHISTFPFRFRKLHAKVCFHLAQPMQWEEKTIFSSFYISRLARPSTRGTRNAKYAHDMHHIRVLCRIVAWRLLLLPVLRYPDIRKSSNEQQLQRKEKLNIHTTSNTEASCINSSYADIRTHFSERLRQFFLPRARLSLRGSPTVFVARKHPIRSHRKLLCAADGRMKSFSTLFICTHAVAHWLNVCNTFESFSFVGTGATFQRHAELHALPRSLEERDTHTLTVSKPWISGYTATAHRTTKHLRGNFAMYSEWDELLEDKAPVGGIFLACWNVGKRRPTTEEFLETWTNFQNIKLCLNVFKNFSIWFECVTSLWHLVLNLWSS